MDMERYLTGVFSIGFMFIGTKFLGTRHVFPIIGIRFHLPKMAL